METKDNSLSTSLQALVNSLHLVTKIDVRFYDMDFELSAFRIGGSIPTSLSLDKIDLEHMKRALLAEKDICCYYINSFRLEYIASGYYHQSRLIGFLVVGPFLSLIPDLSFISDVIYKNKFPISERNTLRQFYQSLSVLSNNDTNALSHIVSNMTAVEASPPKVAITDVSTPFKTVEALKDKVEENNTIVEARYEHEKRFLDTITMGDLEKLKDLNKKSAIFFSIPDRIPNDPTRSFKNLLFVLNTLCRTAARKGGVNPIYIHNLSEKFAIMIEKAPNLPFLKKLSEIIPIEYCELVQSHSTSGYSPIVRQAIDYINLNLESSLALTEIADTIPSNPSHLSRKFKAETGHTITEYINQQRVKEAKLLLEQKDMSITDVAFIVGFNDLNYFTRVFKKMTQITPSQYAKEASN